MGDSIKLFCLKSFYSLFTNMMENQEIAYTILDLLFLYGDPINSRSFFDEECDLHQEGESMQVNVSTLQTSTSSMNAMSQKLGNQTSFEPCQLGCPYTEKPKDPKEPAKTSRVHIDRTTQLLTSIAIAISDIVKMRQKRMPEREKRQMKEQMFVFEQAIEREVRNKSYFLGHVLCIETIFFGRNRDAINRTYKESPPMLLTDKQYDEQYSWNMSNALFGHCLDEIKNMTVKRMPKTATMKNNFAKKTQSLDKQKFLLKFVAFEGLLQFQDGKFPEMQKLINEDFAEKLEEKRKLQARQSMNTEYYGSYPQEEVLVDVQTCGGYNYYPICLYDFTTKVLDHDHLVFSTRHLIPPSHCPSESNEESKE